MREPSGRKRSPRRRPRLAGTAEAERRELLAAERFIGAPPAGGGPPRCVLLYPNRYRVGMSSLAVHTLWRLLSAAGWHCERAFLDPVPGRTLTENLPLSEYDLLAVHLSYEPDYLHLPGLLEAGGVPPLRDDRGPQAPLVLAGGPAVTANPEPLADLCDLLFIGEIEPAWAQLREALAHAASSREAAREAAAAVPGVYAPGAEQAGPVTRQVLREVDAWPTASVLVTPATEFSDMFLIEVGRGCPHTCRFCLSREIYHPFRPRSAEALLEVLRPGLQVTDRVGLVGAAVSDHPQLLPLGEQLVEEGAQISASSLRADAVTPRLLELLARSGARSLTLAPETGTDELRRAVGKPLRQEHLRAALAAAQEAGMQGAKLYFMVGLPGETAADRAAIGELVGELRSVAPRLRLEVTLSPLVPKAHTPWAELEMPPPQAMRRYLTEARRAVERQGVPVSAESVRWWLVQTALSRGGRELGRVLVQASREGGEAADLGRAGRAAGYRLEDYLKPPRVPPWQVVEMRPCETGRDR